MDTPTSTKPAESRPTEQGNVRARIMVATPCYTGDVAYECAESMRRATIYCLQRGVLLDWQFFSDCSLVQYARNWLTAIFLETPEYTHLLWLDDDEGFDPNAIMKLVDSNLDVVGGVVPARTGGATLHEPIGKADGPIQRMHLLHGGFLMLRRHVVETLASRSQKFRIAFGGVERICPHVFDVALTDHPLHPGEKMLGGEDIMLSLRLIELGFPLYARTDIQFIHVGRYCYTGCAATDI